MDKRRNVYQIVENPTISQGQIGIIKGELKSKMIVDYKYVQQMDRRSLQLVEYAVQQTQDP